MLAAFPGCHAFRRVKHGDALDVRAMSRFSSPGLKSCVSDHSWGLAGTNKSPLAV